MIAAILVILRILIETSLGSLASTSPGISEMAPRSPLVHSDASALPERLRFSMVRKLAHIHGFNASNFICLNIGVWGMFGHINQLFGLAIFAFFKYDKFPCIYGQSQYFANATGGDKKSYTELFPHLVSSDELIGVTYQVAGDGKELCGDLH
jgi:hypothetical protein